MFDLKGSLQQSDYFFWKLPELMPCGCSIATDFTCQKIIHNPVAARFYGIEPWSSLSFSSSSPPEIKVYQDGRLVMPREMPIQRSAWRGDENNMLELEFVWPDGVSKTSIWSTCPLRNETGVIIGAIGIFEDVTELITNTRVLNAQQRHFLQEIVDEGTKKLKEEFEKRILIEREVAKDERLNVIRQLSAGLAHEVRNPMTTIRGFLQLLQNKTELLRYKSQFDLMIDEVDRANSIITDFLYLSRHKQAKFKPQNLNELLINIFPLLQADAFNQGKKLLFELGDIANLDIDSNEITQLVLNLTRNGLEAMPQDGCLRIKTFVDNQTIVLSVMDEGTGIITEHISKLGTLFFTTKENGSGLGMPMCYDIADRHRARIEVESSSAGTTVFVRFPLLKGTGGVV
ncbi:MAG: ATP-binding protein [Desulfosporosinus sp.]|nr:ATP-binding protein [Desulfosporosinus sp.]